jgi:hypothetical protein
MITETKSPKNETCKSVTKIDEKIISPCKGMVSHKHPVQSVTPKGGSPATINIDCGSTNFGSGTTSGNYSFKMSMNEKGDCTFKGTYKNMENSYPQAFCIALAVRSNNGLAFTFSYKGVAEGGKEVTFNFSANSKDIAKNWAQINAAYWWNYECCNNLNLSGDLTALKDCLNDVEKVGAVSKVYHIIDKSQDPPTKSITWNWPDKGFGSGPNNANFLGKVTMNSDGSWKYSGTYQNTGSVPIVTAPNQSFQVVADIIANNGVAFAFSYAGDVKSRGNDGSSGDANWNLSGTHKKIEDNWMALCYTNSTQYLNAQNSLDWGSLFNSIEGFINQIEQDIETIEEVVEVVVAVVAAVC